MEQEKKAEDKYAPVEETIDIVKGGKPRPTRVKRFWVDWKGKKEEVIIKRLTYGERADFTAKFTKLGAVGTQMSTDIDMKVLLFDTLLMCLHKAPFPIVADYVQHELDGDIGEQLFRECDKFNKLNPIKKKDFSGDLKTEQKIPSS